MTNENESYYGLGMSAPADSHQTSSDIILLNFFRRFGIATGVSAIAVTKDPERIPDITFCRLGTDLNDIDKQKDIVMTIELVRNDKNYNASLDSIGITFQLIPSLKESFIYDYKKKNWTRVTRNKNGTLRQESGNDFSKSFGIHLNTLIGTDETARKQIRARKNSILLMATNIVPLTEGECRTNAEISFDPTIEADIAVFESLYADDTLTEEDTPLMSVKIIQSPTDESFAVKCAKESFAHVTSMVECFVYNMHSDRWTRVSRDGSYIITEKDKDYSRVLKKYMHTLMR